MKKPSSIAVILLIMFVVLLFLFIQQSKELTSLNSEFTDFKADMQSQISEKDQQISALTTQNSKLKSQLDTKTSQYDLLKEQYDSLDTSYSKVKTEVDMTIEDISEFEERLNESMAWFNENSLPVGIPNENRIRNTLARCFDESGDECNVKLGCFYLINDKKLNLKYKLDTITSQEADQLQSLEEFIRNLGGDCEDYSLFYKAEYNLVNQICEERGSQDMVLEAWVSGTGEYYLDFSQEWYLDGADPVEITGTFPNIVCGDMHDPNSGRTNGHCVIAFSNYPINNINELDQLQGASLVEPQNGMYLGQIGESIGLEPTIRSSRIWMVITDHDLYLYDDGWTGYSVILGELSGLLQSLESLR